MILPEAAPFEQTAVVQVWFRFVFHRPASVELFRQRQFCRSAKNASRLIPAVRIKLLMMSSPTSSYLGMINGLAEPGFSSFM